MTKETLAFLTEKTHDLMAAFSCSAETKASCQRWLDAVGTPDEAQATRRYLEELAGDIMPLEMLIAFADSEQGAAVFGEKAPQVAAHGRELRAAGRQYCDCPACAAVEAILARREEILA